MGANLVFHFMLEILKNKKNKLLQKERREGYKTKTTYKKIDIEIIN